MCILISDYHENLLVLSKQICIYKNLIFLKFNFQIIINLNEINDHKLNNLNNNYYIGIAKE